MVTKCPECGMACPPNCTACPGCGCAMSGGKMDRATPFRTQEEADRATEQRKAFVKKLAADVARWKDHHKDAHKKMKANVKFVLEEKEQWRSSAGLSPNDDRYVANITHRFIQQKVSSLYARDPRVKAKRRPMIDGVVWDGRQETLETAMMTLGMAGGQPKGPPPDPKIEIEKAKLDLAGKKELAAATLAQQKQAADVADQQAGRLIDQKKLELEMRVKMGELEIRRQEAAVKLKELGIKQQELGIQRAALASDNHNKGMDRTAQVNMNRESIGATATMQAADQQHEKATQQADQQHAGATAKQDRAHDAEQQKRDLAGKKAVAKKKGPTNAK